MSLDPAKKSVTCCPECDSILGADSGWFGRSLLCPRCGEAFVFQALTSGDTVDDAALVTQDVDGTAGRTRRKRSPDQLPQSLGRYLPKERLGEGGFGTVFRAVDPVLSRDVAIKLPLAGQQKRKVDERTRKRFTNEARAAARLRHPNIVSVFDYGVSDDDVYIVYEFVPGETLEDLIKRGDYANEIEQSIRWIATLADALDYAAEAGIVHRDIKPANIMIDTHDHPQIMDFGLAEALQEGKARTGGKIAGTPIYMSPEQARGESQIGPAADQYGLSAILYELCTGCRPVESKGMAAVAEVAQREGPPTEPLAALPGDLRAIILRAMASDPGSRYSTCQEFGADLRFYLGGRPVVANRPNVFRRSAMWARRNRSTAVALATVLVLLVAVAGISTAAALTLEFQRQRLKFALRQEEIAKEEASQNEKIAQEARDKAEAETKRAEENRKKAEDETKKALAALQREREAIAQQKLAEKKAADEAERRRESDMAAKSAQGQLLRSEKESQSLKYASFLAKAYSETIRGDVSAVNRTLERCAPSDRGWEWQWISKRAVAKGEFTPLSRIPMETRRALTIPRLPLKEDEFKVRFPVQTKKYAPLNWKAEFEARFNQRQTFGALVQPNDSRNRRGSYSPRDERALFLYDYQTGEEAELGPLIAAPSGLAFAGPTTLTFISQDGKTVGKGQTAKEFLEVWNVSGIPRPIVRHELSEKGFVPSSVVLSSRNVLLSATESQKLATYDMTTGDLISEVDLDFRVCPGPNAMNIISNELVAICSPENRFYFINSQSSELIQGAEWGQEDIAGKEILWSQDNRYLAISKPGKVSVVMPDREKPPRPSRQWMIVDSNTESVLGNLEMPVTEAEIETRKVPTDDGRQQIAAFVTRQALPLRKFLVSEGGNSVAALDESGGVWAWQRVSSAGDESRRTRLPAPIKLADRAGSAIVATNGVDLIAEKQSPGSGDARAEIKKLLRRRGGELVFITQDPLSDQIATVDRDGYVTVYESTERKSESPPLGQVNCGEFFQAGSKLVVGTEQGEILTVDTATGKVLRRIRAHNPGVISIQSVRGHGVLASTGRDRMLKLWDAVTGIQIPIPDTFVNSEPLSLSYDTEVEKLIVCMPRNVAIYECDRKGFRRIVETGNVSHGAERACFFDGGKRILVAGDRNASIFRTDDGQFLFGLPVQSSSIELVESDRGDPWLLLETGQAICYRIGRE